MFKAHNKVRMHDTDMAGILYFPRQFRFVHDALEDLVEIEGLSFHDVFNNKDFVFVIRHCEADYFTPLRVGDKLDVHVSVENMGNTSFTMLYEIYRDKQLVGTARTVHVTLSRKKREKIPVPDEVRQKFIKYLKHD